MAVLATIASRAACENLPYRRMHTRACFFINVHPIINLTAGALLFLNCPLSAAQSDITAPALLKKLSVEQLMDIDVTSVSKRPEKLSETASAVQVITEEDIRRAGATSLPEALRLATNLEVAQIDSRQWAISARGFNSTTANKLLVLIDGRTIYTPLYAGVFWDANDTLLEDIEQIEVISGPGATLWGANAVNGVINITTRHAGDTSGLLLSAAAGDALKTMGSLRSGGKLGAATDYRVYAKYTERNDTLLPSGASARNAWDMAQAGFRIDGALSDSDTFTVQGDAYQGQIGQLSALGVALDDIEISGGNVLGRWSRALSAQSDLKLQFYFDRSHRSIPGSYTEDLDTYDLDFQHRFVLAARHEILWGANYRYIDDNIPDVGNFSFLPPHVTRQWYGAFVQDDITLSSQLNLTIGTKLEHNEYTGYELQPSARLAWRVNDVNTVWSAVSRAVRAPSRIDGELVAPSAPPYSLIAPNPDFESEELLAYELGYRSRAITGMTTSLSLFYNDYDKVRSIEHVNPPAMYPLFIGNGLTAKSYGAELLADYAVTDTWRLRAGYTELRISFDHRPNSTDTNSGTTEAHDPRHYWSLRSSHDLPHNISLDAIYRRVGRIADQNVPGYGELDLRISWLLPRNIEISLTGQNLLHSNHGEFGAVTSRQKIERSAYGKVTWQF